MNEPLKDILALNKERFKALENSATEAERLLGQYLQYLAFIDSPTPEKARPGEFDIAPLYLYLARQMLSETHADKFLSAYRAAIELTSAALSKRKVQETLNERKP